jgi:hypothetical protein
MSKLKDEILKLSKAEQYEIYEAIESNLFDERSRALTKEQMEFINERLAIVDSGKATFVSPEQLRQELDKITG